MAATHTSPKLNQFAAATEVSAESPKDVAANSMTPLRVHGWTLGKSRPSEESPTWKR